jgi:hypothetical protein
MTGVEVLQLAERSRANRGTGDDAAPNRITLEIRERRGHRPRALSGRDDEKVGCSAGGARALRESRVAVGALDQPRRIDGIDGGTQNPPGVRA